MVSTKKEEKKMLKIKEISVPGYAKVIEITDPQAKLHGFIAIHDLTLGPAMGGMRIYPYENREAALKDVLRLAKGMTYKSALAENGLGGGKAVIIADSRTQKTEPLLLAFAEAVNSLEGKYITAEDLGSDTNDMAIVRRKTHYVCALQKEHSSGDPSRFTAYGIYKGMQAVAQHLWHNPSLRKKKIAIQGLGHVGNKLAEFLFWEGAELILSDIDQYQMNYSASQYGAKMVSPKDFIKVDCDILAPCAIGGTINKETIPHLRCKAIAGSANNQLGEVEDGERLRKKGILYAPDIIINSGGVINVGLEFDAHDYDPKKARSCVEQIYSRLVALFNEAEKEQKPTNIIADAIAERNLKNKVGLRKNPIHFK